MTLEELEDGLPNGFHDAKICSLALDYAAGTARFHLNLWVGAMEDPQPERETYRTATLLVTGVCLCSIESPDPSYRFLPETGVITVSGDSAKPDHLPTLPGLMEKFPAGTWCYRFFVQDWNAFIHVAGRDATLIWIGKKTLCLR